ncbi:hypothetical protein F5H01DRAFT_360900 [Linnemannia elongata]|nr:hypothetical protein F5H01DRAFT_360900 [Linnemannia elongata]
MPYPIRPNSLPEAPIRKFAATLEVLIASSTVCKNDAHESHYTDAGGFSGDTEAIIPHLTLVHFAVVEDTYSLLPLVDPKFLSAFHVPDIRNVTFDSLWDSDTLSPAGCQIESLRIEATNLATFAFESQFS